MQKKYAVLFWMIFAVVSVMKLYYIGWGPLDLSPDEAQYWNWSRNLDICYYSKGPFIAYTIFFGTKLGELVAFNPPNPAFWTRFPAVLNSMLLGIIVWFLSYRLWKDYKIALWIVLILLAIPIYAVGSIIMTIDNPLMLFWALYIYVILLALESKNAKYWYISGVVLGLGFLSKYAMFILIPGTIVFLLTGRQHKEWLRRKEFYLSILIACLFAIPVLYWNMSHDWIGMKHLIGQAGLAKHAEAKQFFSPHLFEFVGTQMGVVSPIIFVFIIISFYKAWKLRSDYRYNLLFWMGVPVAVLYMLLSLHKECQANWTAPLYISGAILAGAIFQKNTFLKIGIVLGVSAWLLLFNIDFLPGIPQKYDPTLRLTGWKLLGEEVGGVKEEYQKDSPIFIFSDTYQIASELAFYTPEQPRTYNVNLGRRMNQYDIWGGFDKLTGNDGLYVKHRDQVIDPEIASAFSSWEKLPVVNIIKNGEIIHRYTIFLCREFKGIKGHGDESSY